MGKVTYYIQNYKFNKPPIISEKEFLVFKEIFRENPKYNINPKSGFLKEFAVQKWGLLVIAIFGLLSLIWEEFELVFGIGVFIAIIGLFQGGGESMLNYLSYIGEKNKYYKDLKNAIIDSENYTEFHRKASVL
jgi:hypothetical protein